MVWAIWDGFASAHLEFSSPGLPQSMIRSVDQCISMSNAALGYGCDMDNSIAYMHSPRLSNPLFKIVDHWDFGTSQANKVDHWSYGSSQAVMDAIRYLRNIGYDIEERNSRGETLYLYGATLIDPFVITSLKFLIEIGADTSAMDLHNCGALHLALMPPYHWGAWGSSCTENCNHDEYGHEIWASEMFLTESESYAEDYCNDGLTPAPSTVDEFQSNRLACDARSQKRLYRTSGGKFFPTTDSIRSESHMSRSRHGQYVDLDETDDDNEDEEIDVEDEDEDEDEEEASSEDSSREVEDETNEDDDTEHVEIPKGYILRRDHHNRARIIRDPLPILKTRLRFKLLTLLRAGCDPNALDNKGNSPSDDARYHGLWPEWTWALLNAGYGFDKHSNLWMKNLEEVVSFG